MTICQLLNQSTPMSIRRKSKLTWAIYYLAGQVDKDWGALLNMGLKHFLEDITNEVESCSPNIEML